MTKWSLIYFHKTLYFPCQMGKRKNEDLLRKIALRIKALRDTKGVTQEDFYNDTGIHVGRIESLKRNVSITTIEDICNYFNITISEFFDDGFR